MLTCFQFILVKHACVDDKLIMSVLLSSWRKSPAEPPSFSVTIEETYDVKKDSTSGNWLID